MKPSSAPSHVFVVRHGARLDMVDKDWASTTAEPYNTPLTYGGWQQTRSIGMRIASLLEQSKANVSANGRTKKTKVVIHTSPFLRCIQTSVSIASGLAQHHHQAVTNSHWVDDSGKIMSSGSVTGDAADNTRFSKPLLRIDAWLSEWMNVDYYTDVTPPPGAQTMVSSAKSEYMRPSDGPAPRSPMQDKFSLRSQANALPASTTGGFIPPSPVYAVSGKDTIPQGFFSHAKEYVDLDYAWDSARLGDGAELGEEWSSMHRRFRNGYKRLVWYYNDEKPEVSTALTSSRWGTMAKRPVASHGSKVSSESVVGVGLGVGTKQAPSGRKPICKETISEEPEEPKDEEDLSDREYPEFTLDTANGNPTPPLSDSGDSEDLDSDDDDDDDDINTIVILVTHGAGCNALLGALTHQPVLIDIGIGSLTMAVRKSQTPDSTVTATTTIEPPTRKNDVPEPPVKYDLKLVASTDHARHLPSINTPPMSPLLDARGNPGLGPGAFTLSTSGPGPNSSLSTIFGTQKTIRSASHGNSTRPTGLWSPIAGNSPRLSPTRESPFSEDNKTTATTPKAHQAHQCTPRTFVDVEPVAPVPAVMEHSGTTIDGVQGPVEKRGLWAAKGWDRTPKRRWTVGREGFVNIPGITAQDE